MVRRSNKLFGTFDIILFGLFLVLVFFGWLNIYSASLNADHLNIFDSSQEYGKQFIWICISMGLGFFIMLLDGDMFKQFALPFYGFSMLLLLAVLIFGKEVNGAKSWFGVGSFGIQPSEFAKLGLALALPAFLVSTNEKKPSLRSRLISIVLISIPAGLILLQPDPGTTLVFGSMVLVLYREGLSGNILLFALLAIVMAIVSMLTIYYEINLFGLEVPGYAIVFLIIVLCCVSAFLVVKYFVLPRHRARYVRNIIVSGVLSIFLVAAVSFVYHAEDFLGEGNNILKEHHINRLDVLFGHKEDPRGVGYNVNQSKIAIGSGGAFGKGYTDGTLTKYKYVPMQSTDFIFCTIGEEWGFAGSALIVLLFFFLLYRIIFIAERQRSRFTRIYAYAVASILFFHFLINIGMTIGLAPVIGIPLPFFSYGGSSLMVFSLMIFILLKLDSERLDILR